MKIDVNVPDGISGDWKVETFEVSKEEAKRFNFRQSSRDMIEEGKYKRLVNGFDVVMSNTSMEINTHREAIESAQGTVLVAGLGLGMYLTAISQKEEVEKIIVIEKSKDVINLVASSFNDNPKITIINDDIFTWKPEKGMKFDFIWFDIWTNICSDNVEEMTKLKRKFAKRTKKQLCWVENDCRRMKKRCYYY